MVELSSLHSMELLVNYESFPLLKGARRKLMRNDYSVERPSPPMNLAQIEVLEILVHIELRGANIDGVEPFSGRMSGKTFHLGNQDVHCSSDIPDISMTDGDLAVDEELGCGMAQDERMDGATLADEELFGSTLNTSSATWDEPFPEATELLPTGCVQLIEQTLGFIIQGQVPRGLKLQNVSTSFQHTLYQLLPTILDPKYMQAG
jgi:hypothetical protein